MEDTNRRVWTAGLLILWLAAVGPGCRSRIEEAPADAAGPATPASAVSAEREIWEVASIQGVRVGYSRTTIRRVDQEGRGLVLIEGLTRIALRRFGSQVLMTIHTESTETPEGKLVACESVKAEGTTTAVTRGRVAGNELRLETTTSGKTTTEVIPWSPDCGGFYALQESLTRSPMKPGDQRTIRALVPGINQVSTVALAARRFEPVDLSGKSVELLRIDSTTTLDKLTVRDVLWADREGEIWKTRTEMLNMEMLRTTKEEALRATEPGEVDFAWNVSIPVSRALPHPHATKRVRYRVRLKGGNPAEVFASGPSQQVRPVDEHTAEVTVLAIRPGQPGGNPDVKAAPPTAKDREPNNWIQSDCPEIVAAAREAADDLKDPWALAVALERATRSRIPRPGFSQAFDTAADVIRSGEGDCTEHAVLLAAMARARGIPARVAIGLVYHKQSFLYHMWTEMYLEGRWTGMDATLAQGGIGAAHLKLLDSNLAGASALSCFLPVAQVAGRLKIEILEAE